MTVTGLFNITATLLLGSDDLGGPQDLFYFYTYFVIFLVLGAYFWPLFVAHTLVRRLRWHGATNCPCSRPDPAVAAGVRWAVRPTNSAPGCTACCTRALCSGR